MISTLVKISVDDIEAFLLFFPENRICYFMQFVSDEDNLHKLAES